MLRKKGLVGLSIFTIMFVTAWWGNGMTERYYHVDPDGEHGGVQLLRVNPEGSIRLEPFKPREYIRVQNQQPYIRAE